MRHEVKSNFDVSALNKSVFCRRFREHYNFDLQWISVFVFDFLFASLGCPRPPSHIGYCESH